jgi:branched-chain amino acid transport system permease protein
MLYLLACLGASRLGWAFDAIRQDETVAVALGVPVAQMHRLAFALSGAIAGLGGALDAFNTYSITPDQFGFRLVIASLAAVVLGGRVSVAGPLAGAAILTVLPELARPFKDFSLAVHGALLLLVITLLPDGIVDGLRHLVRRARMRRPPLPAKVGHGAPVA